jgi:hypothetical protein
MVAVRSRCALLGSRRPHKGREVKKRDYSDGRQPNFPLLGKLHRVGELNIE